MIAQADVPIDPSWWANYGIAGVLLLVVGIVCWRVGVWLGRRLFDDDKGYVSRVVERHVKFMDCVTESQEAQKQINARSAAALETLAEGSDTHKAEHKRTHRVLGHMVEAADKAVSCPEVRKILDKAREELSD